ncbi:hypothetical protein PTKIN_Ptkin08bG0185700 [Pterospermum kingtungense]
MGTDAAEVVETPSYPTSFKVHHMMCTELRKLVERIIRIFPEIESARPRCSSGIKALCSLNSAIDKAKLLLQYCSESSKLYLAITTDAIVSRCQKSKNLLEQGLCQIQSMVPVMLAVEISQIVDDLRAAKFIPDQLEEEAGKVVRELLQRGPSGSDSMEDAEMRALQTAASRLRITSSTAILMEKRSIKKLLEKVSDTDQQKKKVLKYLLYLLRKYANLIIGEQTDNATDQNEGAFAVSNPSTKLMNAHSVDVESHMENKHYDAQADKLSRDLPPEEFKCPISSRLMYDPVIIASGQTFERIWIQKWFDDGNDTCPKTGMKLDHLSLTPNAAMKDMISKWCMKYGIAIQDPSMQLDVLHSLENSSTSIASFGSSMNDIRFPVDISSISLGSLDTSYTSDASRNKLADGLNLIAEQSTDDLCQYQSPSNASRTDLESLSSLAELDWESKCKMVEDMKTHLKCDDLACLSMSALPTALITGILDRVSGQTVKVHHMMCTELRKLVERIIRIFPEIESARPRCSSGIKALCSLNSAIDKAKLLLQYCSESSKLYLAITTDAIVSRCQKSKNLLEQGLCQIQSMVPVMLAVEISQIVDDLRAANFVPDKYEEEAGKVVRELLQRGASGSDSMEYAEMRALQTAASGLRITSSTAILIEKRSIKKLLEKVSDTDQQKKKILKYLLYLLRKYANLIIGEQTDNATDQNEGAFAVRNPSTTHSVDVESHMENKHYDAQADKLSRALPPEEFKCPISSRLMYDPVIIASGQTFERIWIQKWFDDGNDTCPKSGMKLDHLSLTPNAAMKDLISKWCMKYGITIQDPSMQLDVLHSLENSSTSIASFGSSMNDIRFPVDISSISLGSLDTSYTSDASRNKLADGLNLIPEQTTDDLCQYQSPSNASRTDLESISSLAELDWESKCKMVEDMKTHLKCDDLACLSMSSKNFIEPLINFLSSAHDSHDTRAVRSGLQLLWTFLSKNRSGIQYLNEDAYSLLLLFLDSEVTKEVLDIMQVLSGHTSSTSKIAASGALFSILNILDSKMTDFRERVIKILRNLSSSSDVCSTLVSLECIPKFVPFLEDTTLARHCIVLLRNLCCNQEARASITETPGCIYSVAIVLETGSYEDQEHALAILLALCSQRVEYCRLVMDECDIFPALFDVSVNGSEKGKASALELLRLLRDTNIDDDNDAEQERFQSDNVTSEDANDYSKQEKSHKSLFGVKLPVFSRSSKPKKKK